MPRFGESSTRVEDYNLPRREVCLGCHTDAVIKSPRLTPLAHFSHQKHTKILDCLQCHRGIDTSEVTSQVTWPANFPRMADCVTCHEQNDMPNGCWKCHSKSMQLKPAFHISDFVDSHSQVKHSAMEKASCDVCHGKNFRCAGCH